MHQNLFIFKIIYLILKENLVIYLKHYGREFTIIKAVHKEIILDIIQSIIKEITNPLKMLISSNSEQKIDVGKFLSEVNNTEEKVVLEKPNVDI